MARVNLPYAGRARVDAARAAIENGEAKTTVYRKTVYQRQRECSSDVRRARQRQRERRRGIEAGAF